MVTRRNHARISRSADLPVVRQACRKHPLRRPRGAVLGPRIDPMKETNDTSNRKSRKTMKKMSLRARVLTGAVAAAALGAGTFGAVSANAAAPAARRIRHGRGRHRAPQPPPEHAPDRRCGGQGRPGRAGGRAGGEPAGDGRRRRPQRQHRRHPARRRRGPAVVRVRAAQGVHRGLLERARPPCWPGGSSRRRT